MKPISEMIQAEFAAYVQTELRKENIHVVLSGGAVVAIYSNGAYVSKDIDLVNARFTNMNKIERILVALGFNKVGRHFEHPDSEHIVEFPPGPLSLGDEIVDSLNEIEYETGTLEVLTPTDCIKDRLAHFYHWGDRQCLQQAIFVARGNKVDLTEVGSWSEKEGKLPEFEEFKKAI